MDQMLKAAKSDERAGDWLQTYSGRRFWPLDPRPDEVRIIDIAHALSMKCRYGGHTDRFYSVAEHSVLISRAVAPEHALWGLLHDAGEAYLADVPKPVKPFLRDWREIEARVMRAVCLRFNLPEQEPPEVKSADHAILTDEKLALMKDGPAWGHLIAPLGVTIHAMAPTAAERVFMDRFIALGGGLA